MLLVVTNRKGGTGKTAIAVNVASVLAMHEEVLLIDLDPQADASAGLGIDDTGERFAGALLGRAPPASAVIETQWGVDVAAAGQALAYVHDRVRPEAVGDFVRALWPGRYRSVVIDCPPGTTGLVLSAWRASPEALGLVPVCGPQALRAFSRLRDGWEDIGMDTSRLRAVFTRYDRRRVLDRALEQQARERYGSVVLQTRLRESVVVGESAAHRQPLLAYASGHPATEDMRLITKEVSDV